MEQDAFPRGVKLSRNDLGSWVIEVNGNFVGWIHANLGDKWIAYVRALRKQYGRPFPK